MNAKNTTQLFKSLGKDHKNIGYQHILKGDSGVLVLIIALLEEVRHDPDVLNTSRCFMPHDVPSPKKSSNRSREPYASWPFFASEAASASVSSASSVFIASVTPYAAEFQSLYGSLDLCGIEYSDSPARYFGHGVLFINDRIEVRTDNQIPVEQTRDAFNRALAANPDNPAIDIMHYSAVSPGRQEALIIALIGALQERNVLSLGRLSLAFYCRDPGVVVDPNEPNGPDYPRHACSRPLIEKLAEFLSRGSVAELLLTNVIFMDESARKLFMAGARMESLSIDSAWFMTAESVPAWDALPLRELCLREVRATPEAAESVFQSLARHETLRILNLRGVDLVGPFGRSLADALRSNTSIEAIDFMGSRLGEGEAEAVGAALGIHPAIQTLELDYGHTSEEGLISCLRLLKRSRCLTTLTLDTDFLDCDCDRPPIGINVTHAIVDLLRTSTSLRVLNLEACGINNDDVPMLAGVLKMCHLRTLNLQCNEIGSVGVQLFINAIEGSHLEVLDLSDNLIVPELFLQLPVHLRDRIVIEQDVFQSEEADTTSSKGCMRKTP